MVCERYCAGPKTALRAGLAAWAVFVLVPFSAIMPLELFPNRLMFTVIGVGLVDVSLATLLGAWLYKETYVLCA